MLGERESWSKVKGLIGARSGLGSSDPNSLPSPLVTNLPVSQRYIKVYRRRLC